MEVRHKFFATFTNQPSHAVLRRDVTDDVNKNDLSEYSVTFRL